MCKITTTKEKKELVITHDAAGTGFGMYVDDQPWSFFKYGDSIIPLMEKIVNEGFTSVMCEGTLTNEERKRDFE